MLTTFIKNREENVQKHLTQTKLIRASLCLTLGFLILFFFALTTPSAHVFQSTNTLPFSQKNDIFPFFLTAVEGSLNEDVNQRYALGSLLSTNTLSVNKYAALAVDPNAKTEVCPADMVLVEGESCTEVRHKCVRPMKDDPAHRCYEFDPTGDECIGPRTPLKFCMDRYEWPGVPGVKPRVLVTYFEAEKLCKSLGKRMCEEDEFYLACEGPKHWPYAWGHQRHPSTCNIDRPYRVVNWSKWAQGTDVRIEEARRLDQAMPIGTTQCWSPYGIHDIAGNADEWTHARKGRTLLGSLNGGYWGPVQNACRYVTTIHGPEFMFYQIGFRCCSEARDTPN